MSDEIGDMSQIKELKANFSGAIKDRDLLKIKVTESSGEIEALRQQINTFDTRIAEKDKQIGDLHLELVALQNKEQTERDEEIDDLKSEVVALQREKQELSNKVMELDRGILAHYEVTQKHLKKSLQIYKLLIRKIRT